MEQIGNFLGGITNTLGQIGTAIGGQINSWLNPMNTPVNYGSNYGSGFSAPTHDEIPTSTINLSGLSSQIGGEISNFLSNPLQNITNTLTGLYGNISNGFTSVNNFINSALGNMSSSIGSQFFGSIGNLIGGIDNSLGVVTQAIAPAITPLTGAVNSVIALIPQNIKDALGGVVQGFKDITTPLTTGLSNAITGIGTLFTQSGTQQAQKIADAIRDAQGATNSAIGATNAQIVTALGQQSQVITNITTGLGSGVDKFINALLNTELKIESTIALWWIDFEAKTKSFITEKFNYATEQLNAPIGHLQEITGKLIHGEYNSFNDLLADFTVNPNNAGLIDALIQIAYLVSSTMAISSAIGGVTGKAVNRLFEQDTKLELLSPNDYASLMVMFPSQSDLYKSFLYKLGYNDDQIGFLISANRTLLSVSQLITFNRYGLINDTDLQTALQVQNYNDSDINNIIQTVFQPLPFSTYVDNVRRGLYDEQYVNSFGLGIGKPADLYHKSKSVGITNEDADRLYYASFTHPSIEQAKEMFRRGLIDENTYDQIIRYSGIAPKFIEPIKSLTNALLTRRDIKSLHSLGNLSTQEVFQQFRKLGYDDNDASLLTNYTIKYDEENHPLGLQKSKVITESIIKDAYLRRLKDEQSTLTELQNIGYSTNDASFLLSVWNYDLHKTVNSKVEQTHTQKAISNVQQAFLKFTITEQELLGFLETLGYSLANAQQEMLLLEIDRNLQEKEKIEDLIISAYDNYRLDISEVTAKLTQFGFSSDEISAILVKAQLHRELKTTKISVADLDKLLKKQIISPDDYQNQLRAHGYDEVSVSWLSQLVGIT